MTADDLPWEVSAPFVQTLVVGREHLDQFGHTNNVVYLGWLQDLAWAHSVHLGLDMGAYRSIGAGCVARRHELDYLAPSFEGDRLHLATWIAENDFKLSMWRSYQIIRAQDRKTLLRGRTQWVCIDMRSGRPRRQPPEFVAAYQPSSCCVSTVPAPAAIADRTAAPADRADR